MRGDDSVNAPLLFYSIGEQPINFSLGIKFRSGALLKKDQDTLQNIV